MVAQVGTVAFHGVEVIDVETPVTVTAELPAFTVVGLPDKAVAESRERVAQPWRRWASRCRRATSRSISRRPTYGSSASWPGRRDIETILTRIPG